MVRNLFRLMCALVVPVLPATGLGGVEVSGRVKVPEVCAPEVFRAVVRLAPLGTRMAALRAGAARSEVRFIDQRGLRFEPRVVAMRVGEVLRFGNADPELHNVRIQGPGTTFNETVAPAGSAEFIPRQPGIFRVLCDIHPHMRAFVVVGESPWVAACGATEGFHFRDVPDGRYRLHVWHEMAAPLTRDIEVKGEPVDLGTLALEEGANPATAGDRALVCEKGCEPWPLVLDRISLTLAASLDAAQHPGSAGRAVPLVQDAFYRDFEASGMGTAIRVHLGRGRALRIEELFRTITETTQNVATGAAGAPSVIDPTREALVTLSSASEELNRKGVTEWSRTFAETPPASGFGKGRQAATEGAPRTARPAAPGHTPRVQRDTVLWVVVLLAFLAAAACHRIRPSGHSSRCLRWAALIVALVSVMLLNREPSGVAREREPVGKPAHAPQPQAKAVVAPAGAPLRQHPIGLEVVRNHLRIAALWHRAVRIGATPPAPAGATHLLVKIQATEGNPNGFAKGDWVPSLGIRYTVVPARGGPAVSGLLRPLVASDGPRYGANLALAGPGEYRLVLRIAPPSDEALGRLVDPSEGVAPWWEPFAVEYHWTFPPDSP